jgi:hypothetical protein
MESTTKGGSMAYAYNHFGKSAVFDGTQAVVVKALVNDFLELFRKNVHLEIDKEQLEETVRNQQIQLRQLQAAVHASISNLDPDSL